MEQPLLPARDVNVWFAKVASEAFQSLQKRPARRVKLLSDGAHEMCNLLHTHFPAAVFCKVEQGIDVWHVIEKLAPAANVIFGTDRAKSEPQRWRTRLHFANSAAKEILAELCSSGLENRWRRSAAAPSRPPARRCLVSPRSAQSEAAGCFAAADPRARWRVTLTRAGTVRERGRARLRRTGATVVSHAQWWK